MSETLNFRVSSGLKDIIGRELINDKYIAIFELVKNSYDARADEVYINFEEIYSANARITISDNGKGMTKQDIIDKWLFVAYSEKKNPTYRDNINHRTYAGAKGVGRFSCDRLGSKVNLCSKVKEENSAHIVSIDWEQFEKNSQENFTDIDVTYESLNDFSRENGTDIELSDLREHWTRKDILNLKKALSQLVNPNATTEYDKFSIIINVPEEIENDKKEQEDRDKINGVVKNYVFETLDIKTTKISVIMSEDGKTIYTSLEDRGIPLFNITEKSPYTLKNIHAQIYFMSKKAKYNFTRIMGTPVVQYGSVFIYKNGFRVYPYGEPNRDFFNIDRRKGQGFRRFLGTREIVGQIGIYGDRNDLNETSSRNNGFINTSHYQELENFFLEFVLKPLEKYVVNIINWSEEENILETIIDKNNPGNIIKKMKPQTKDSNIVDVNINDELLDMLAHNSEDSASAMISDLKNLVGEKNEYELFEKADNIERKTRELEKRFREASEDREQAQLELDKTSAKLETAEKQVEILKARADLTADEALSAMHIMKGYADAIDSTITEIHEELSTYKEAEQTLKPLLIEVSQTCSKIMNSYNLVLNTNYSANTDASESNIVKFVKKYIEIVSGFNVKIILETPENINANVIFNPLEFSIVIDNILSNSQKANAMFLYISFEIIDDLLLIRFTDDGIGLRQEITDFGKLFEPGFTTTSGSGIGLQTVKKYIEKINGTVKYNEKCQSGFELEVKLKLWI